MIDRLRVGLPDAEFRPVDGFPRYFIGDAGSVLSVVRAGRVLKPTTSPQGYLYVSLMLDGDVHKHLVHRLVASAYVANPLCLNVVNHKNGIKTDNAASNLEWCSYADNNEHARQTGLNRAFGDEHYAARLSRADVDAIRTMAAAGRYHREIAEQFDVCRQHVTSIVNMRSRART